MAGDRAVPVESDEPVHKADLAVLHETRRLAHGPPVRSRPDAAGPVDDQPPFLKDTRAEFRQLLAEEARERHERGGQRPLSANRLRVMRQVHYSSKAPPTGNAGASPLTHETRPAMLDNTLMWSHTRGNTVVPSRWQATPRDPCSRAAEPPTMSPRSTEGAPMRKRIIPFTREGTATPSDDWLDLDDVAEVEITSEDAAHPIEDALLPGSSPGWRAAGPGEHTIRVLFPVPQHLRRIWLEFVDPDHERTQEFVLRWSPDGGDTYHEIVRQQWNFSPNRATSETEDVRVDLPMVTVLDLTINPDISGGHAPASLAQLRLA